MVETACSYTGNEHRVVFLEEGTDERGEYLVIKHVWTHPGTMAGPH